MGNPHYLLRVSGLTTLSLSLLTGIAVPAVAQRPLGGLHPLTDGAHERNVA